MKNDGDKEFVAIILRGTFAYLETKLEKFSKNMNAEEINAVRGFLLACKHDFTKQGYFKK